MCSRCLLLWDVDPCWEDDCSVWAVLLLGEINCYPWLICGPLKSDKVCSRFISTCGSWFHPLNGMWWGLGTGCPNILFVICFKLLIHSLNLPEAKCRTSVLRIFLYITSLLSPFPFFANKIEGDEHNWNKYALGIGKQAK